MVASTWLPPTAFYLLLHLESGCYLVAVVLGSGLPHPPPPNPPLQPRPLVYPPPLHQASSDGYPTGHPLKNATVLLFRRARNKNKTPVAKFAPSLGPVPLPPTPPEPKPLDPPRGPLPTAPLRCNLCVIALTTVQTARRSGVSFTAEAL